MYDATLVEALMAHFGPEHTAALLQLMRCPPSLTTLRHHARELMSCERACGRRAGVKPGIIGASTCAAGKCFLEVSLTPRFDADHAKVAPHGLIGQSYDGDDVGIDGAVDDYTGDVVTTKAMAEGAIEGAHSDYKMASAFSTTFKYSRFDKTSAKPRDVSKLSGKRVGKDSKRHNVAGVGAAADILPTSVEESRGVLELMAGSTRRLEELGWFGQLWHALFG